MDEKAVFKRYDVRGTYPGEIDDEFGKKIGKAIGSFVLRNYEPKIVVTRDNKDSSKSLKNALIEGIVSTGTKVLDAGMGPTDFTAFTGKNNKSVSVQVTSSHLPLEFNGFKFMYPEGNGFTNPDLDQIKQLFRTEEFETGESDILELKSALEEYKNHLKKYLENFETDFDKKVVVDTLGGATHPILIEILEELGAEVIDLAETKDKMPYRQPPNPKPEMLDELKQVVNEQKADLGVATDMDGDRITVYRNGFVSGDKLFGVFTQIVDSDVVASVDTSKAVETAIEQKGNNTTYTRVGDPFVLDKAIEQKVDLAGEPNGHYAFLEFVPYPSGILSGLIASGIDLDMYLEKIPDHYIERKNIEVEDKKRKMEKFKEKSKQKFGLISEIDGVKFKNGDTTVLVRSSGSSPKIRIIVESKNPAIAKEVSWKIEKLIQNA
jgi:phosphomannomutase